MAIEPDVFEKARVEVLEALDLVGPGMPRSLRESTPCVGLRRALPCSRASFFWRRGRARTSVVRSLAQRVASGVGRDRVLAAVPRVNRSLPTDHVRASFLNSGINRTT